MDSDDSVFGSTVSTPKIIGKYIIENEIGEGNWGKVKRAVNTETGKQVAVKILYRSRIERKIKDGIKRLYQEFELVRSLDHPGIIKYWEIFESGEKIYLVMDLGGENLDYVLEQDKDRLTPELIRSIVKQLLEAVAYLEEQSISHHDIKTANLLLDEFGHVILCDFGIAERYDKTTGCQSFFGTPTYQAPEIAGNVSGATFDGAKADIWSTGVLLYYLVTGSYPYKADTVYLLLRSIDEDPIIFPDGLNEDLSDFLSKLLEKDSAKRISPAEALKHRWITNETAKVKQKRNTLWKQIKTSIFR